MTYQFAENPGDPVPTKSLGDTIRSMTITIECYNVTDGTCLDLAK